MLHIMSLIYRMLKGRCIATLFCAFPAIISVAQTDLTTLPKVKRDSAIVAVACEYLLQKFPEWYRVGVQPIIQQGNFIPLLGWKWAADDTMPAEWRELPAYLNAEDTWYRVTFYYPYWEEEQLGRDYVADVRLVGKTGEVYFIELGDGSKHCWSNLRNASELPRSRRRLCSLSRVERDSTLLAIAQEAVRLCWAELYRENVVAEITQGDFSRLRFGKEPGAPDYVHPADIKYMVSLYYKDWEKEKAFWSGPRSVVVGIIEKTRECYLIRSGALRGSRERYLLVPGGNIIK